MTNALDKKKWRERRKKGGTASTEKGYPYPKKEKKRAFIKSDKKAKWKESDTRCATPPTTGIKIRLR